MPSMLLSLISVIVTLWVSQAHGQETTCDPPTIAHGLYTPNETKYRLEDVITYRCDNGFYPSSRGNETRCTDGGWTPVPRCVFESCEFPEIKHGALYREDVYRTHFPTAVGQWYYYTCDDLYVNLLSQPNWEKITCTPEGWSPTVPCLKTTCDPPAIAHGLYTPHRTKHRLEDVITYRCDNGFYPSSRGNTAKCTDGGWAPPPRCSLQPCEYPEIKHGNLYKAHRYRPDFPVAVGQWYYYTCDDNYVTPTQVYWGYVTCTPDGWSPEIPCIQKCVVSNLEHGYSARKEQTYVLGESMRVFCHPGYSLHNGESVVTCTEDGWSPALTCLKHCDMPLFENATAITTGKVFRPNDILDYQCLDGYETTDGHTKGSMVCGKDGWSHLPSCFKSAEKCGPPPAVSNGDITSFPLAAYPPGSRVEYQCQAYYELRGPNYVTCIDAKWSEPPKCLDPCVIFEEILDENNIKLKGKEDKTYYAKTGEIIEFTCKSGHSAVTSEQSFQPVCGDGIVKLPRCE